MRFAATIVIAALALTFTQTSVAQLFGGGGEKASTEFIPQTAFAGAAMYPQKIAENPTFKLFPHEIVTAWGKKEIGFDPMLIKQVTWILDKPEKFPPEDRINWAAVLHFEKMQGLAGKMIDKLEEKTVGGKTVYSGAEFGAPSFLVFDESTMIVGEENFFEKLVTADGNGKLVELFKESRVRGQAIAFADVKTVRPMVFEIMKELDKFELPPPVENMRRIPDLVDAFQVGLNTEKKFEATLILQAENSETAEKLNDIIVESLEFAKISLLSKMASELDLNDPVAAASLQYAKRMSEKYEAKLTPVVEGADLTIKLNEELMAVPFLAGLIGWTGSSSMELERKMTPDHQLKQTALAFHNYESVYNRFPQRTIKDENGEPLFSGRVALLPYMEQNNLYNSLHLDEPWDSKHNSEFTSMLIPSFGLSGNGNSTLRFPVYPNSMWDDDGKELGFRDITDGTSNTIFAIDAPPNAAIQWANPKPWNLSLTNPMADVFGDRDEVTVAMLDGSSRVLKKSEMTNEKLKAMLTISGREVIND